MWSLVHLCIYAFKHFVLAYFIVCVVFLYWCGFICFPIFLIAYILSNSLSACLFLSLLLYLSLTHLFVPFYFLTTVCPKLYTSTTTAAIIATMHVTFSMHIFVLFPINATTSPNFAHKLATPHNGRGHLGCCPPLYRALRICTNI